jgi:hypothetical protein
MKKTLIIHPRDESTKFLEEIYKGMRNKTVVRGDMTNQELRKLMKEHDQIFLLGHGEGAYGLLNPAGANFKTNQIIGEIETNILREKEGKCLFIWCWADEYMTELDMRGFATSMFVSEFDEIQTANADLRILNLPEIKELNSMSIRNRIKESNREFSEIVKRYRNDPPKIRAKKILKAYSKFAETNDVAKYNYMRMGYYGG